VGVIPPTFIFTRYINNRKKVITMKEYEFECSHCGHKIYHSHQPTGTKLMTDHVVMHHKHMAEHPHHKGVLKY
jgi:DNA-directed RNA polymerase subunit RPC12/RpoP